VTAPSTQEPGWKKALRAAGTYLGGYFHAPRWLVFLIGAAAFYLGHRIW